MYDDFKRLHEHITETFLNEINEYEKYKRQVEKPDEEKDLENEVMDNHQGNGMNFDAQDEKYREDSGYSGNSLQGQAGRIDFDEGVKQGYFKHGK